MSIPFRMPAKKYDASKENNRTTVGHHNNRLMMSEECYLRPGNICNFHHLYIGERNDVPTSKGDRTADNKDGG